MQKRLTSKEYWKHYWSDEKIDKLTKEKPYFSNLLRSSLSNKTNNFI